MTPARLQPPGVWTRRRDSVAGTNVSHRDARQLGHLLESPEVTGLVADLQATRWTGRPGYPIRAMVGMALAKGIYALPTWTRTVALVAEHAALRAALGCADVAEVPSVYACYRFTVKLHNFKPLLDACIARVLAGLRTEIPEFGTDLAIDGSDLPAYANGQRTISKDGPVRIGYSDEDASWGHRSAISTRKGGGYYGFKLHAAVCTATDLPVAWDVDTASVSESIVATDLLDVALGRGFRPTTCALDKGYDMPRI